MVNLFWKPKEGLLYRSWVGDATHSVSVDAQLEGVGYSAAFKITRDACELWLFPISVKVRRKTDTFSETTTRRALILNLPRHDVDISKQVRKQALRPGEVDEGEIDFSWVRYAVRVKQVSAEDEIRLLEWQKTASLIPERQIVRKRGTAIVDTDRGIVLVSNSSRLYILPGGGAKKEESRMDAAIRELKAQTGLEVKNCRYLFSFDEPEDKKLRNLHEVFLIEVSVEVPKPPKDKKHIEYWHEGSKLHIGNSSKLIIDRYMSEFKTPPFEAGTSS
jgi:8-oxo-dGTP diphosphatase